jgi:hypothetical protein
MLATSVDRAAFGKVVAYSFAAALVLTIAFTTGVLLVESNNGRQASGAARVVGVAAFGLCVVLVAFGLYVMLTTK